MEIDWTDRFWSKVRVDADGCWRWTAKMTRDGYGQFRVGSMADGTRRKVSSHRHAYTLAHGPIPADLVVRHKCDVYLCCNPAHLELGTLADNMRDMVERGRSCRGERHGMAKLTAATVAEIRAAYAAGGRTQRRLAADYCLSNQHISDIVNRKCWTHL